MPGKRTRMGVEKGFRPSRTAALKRAQTRGRKSGMVKVPRNRLAFPQSMKTKLRYSERVEFTPTSTAVIVATFRGNGLNDPYADLGGHQPRGFDQFMDIYQKYTVLSSTCTAQFMYEGYDGPSLKASAGNLTQNRSSTDNVPALTPVCCGLHKGMEALAAGTYTEQIEKERTQWGYITGAGGEIMTLSGKGSSREMFGKKYSIGAEGYSATENTDPTEQWKWEVWAGRVSDDYPQEQVKVVCNVVLTYDCVFTEPKTLAAS